MARAVRGAGADPAFVGMLDGEPVVGIEDGSLDDLARSARKLSTRDLPGAAVRRESGGATVAAMVHLAHRHGVGVAATGGIGGVHPGGARLDESADLGELGRTPITLVCSGAKAILDLPATLERLDSLGVTVVGYGTDELPAFWSAESGLKLTETVASADEAAALARESRALGLGGALLVCVPPPSDAALPRVESDRAVERALEESHSLGIGGAELTPFLLGRVAEITDGRSVRANVALLENNAAVAARIAVATTR
jgi:pseudouridine-5'-phosphate glycosidase